MTVTRSRFALNAIQWINVKADPNDAESEDLWLYSDPAFVSTYPDVLGRIKAAGFDAVMMEVLDTQTLQNYEAMIQNTGLELAPGYCQIGLPEDHGRHLSAGSPEWVRWFDGVRRKAEESNYFGLSTIFLAPEVSWEGAVRTLGQSAVGAQFDQARLGRVTETLAEAARILNAEGIRPGLHNHVGTWVETENEIDYVLSNIDASVLGASFDFGHLAWAGIDPATMIARYSERILDLHIKDIDLAIADDSRRSPVPYRTTVDRGLFVEPGHGDLDLPGAIAALPPAFEGWIIIEVDRTAMDPDDSARTSRQWVEATIPL